MNAEFWNDRYTHESAAYGDKPNAFLEACSGMLPSGGHALLPGDGQGRNGLWVAQQGLSVVSNDLSDIGLAQVKQRAEALSLPLETVAGDFISADLPVATFNFVACLHFHLPPGVRQQAHERIVQLLAPGGMVLLEAYTKDHVQMRERHGTVGGPPTEDMMFSKDIVAGDFVSLTPLYLEELEVSVNEGAFHHGLSKVVRAIFQKPN